MSDAYDAGILEWSEHQSALLRRRAAGELLDEREVDWENVAEEIESVGKSQLSAVRSLLTQALAHELKYAAWPSSREVPGWRAEALRFRIDAADVFSPSMRQRIDVADLFAKARGILPAAIDGPAPQPPDAFPSRRWTSCWPSDYAAAACASARLTRSTSSDAIRQARPLAKNAAA